MFQVAELGQSVPDDEYKQRVLALWPRLLTLQQQIRKHGRSQVLIDFAGVRGAGKSETVNLLNTWMDARWITTHGFDPEVESEAVRPRMWRYWMRLPPRGQVGLFLSGRYTPLLLDRVYGHIDEDEFLRRVRRINIFEQKLATDGALILKFWMHIDRTTQEKRLKRLEKDPDHHWRVTETDWKHFELYDRFVEVSEQIISITGTGHAPWEIVEATDPNHRSLHVGESVSRHIEKHLRRVDALDEYRKALSEYRDDDASGGQARPAPLFDSLDLDLDLPREEYESALSMYQARIGRLQHRAIRQHQSVVLVFEGPDASGKGGAIRRITQAMDARGFKVHPFAAPTDEELRHHYLWRFWRCIPRNGRFAIFDRSWYGRVLVERVEGLADDEDWQRAFREINEFERQLVSHGIVLLKFWIHIDENEQLDRFRTREQKPHKQWKLNEEDWRNREKWDEYLEAAQDAVSLTDRRDAPWVLVEGNSKRYARIKVLQHTCEALERALEDKG